MSRLLVSVRSASEAIDALRGGADVIDVKEPTRGSLGRASASVWREVLDAVHGRVPVSAALGELVDKEVGPFSIPGLAFRKLGLADAPADWRERWTRAMEESGPIPWVAVVYVDLPEPEPEAILDFALARDEVQGVLFDTYAKVGPASDPPGLADRVARIRSEGRFVALAGGLDVERIKQLRHLDPDLFAVRGSACEAGDRLGRICPRRVAALVEAIRG